MGGEAWICGDAGGRKNLSTSEPLRLDRFREHDVEIVTGVLERKRPAMSTQIAADELIDETLKLGHGMLLALDNHGKVSHSFHGTLVSELRPFI